MSFRENIIPVKKNNRIIYIWISICTLCLRLKCHILTLLFYLGSEYNIYVFCEKYYEKKMWMHIAFFLYMGHRNLKFCIYLLHKTNFSARPFFLSTNKMISKININITLSAYHLFSNVLICIILCHMV